MDRSTARDGALLAEEYCQGTALVTWYESETTRSRSPAGARSLGLGVAERCRQVFTTAFLPEGYPLSVTEDYLGFQLWDTIQGLCSYVRGMLSGQAILKGVGVGQKAATPLGAVFQFFVRDMSGMVGGILFAYSQGSGFDACAKQWRIFADVINDIGMAVELASPMFPGLFLLMACFGSIARSMTGVAGGATRAALTQHFALSRNAADISAKEHSQETAVTVLGMILGMLTTHLAADSHALAWAIFLVLTWLHVLANIKALRCLVLTSLNQPRIDSLLAEFRSQGKVGAPKDMRARESLLPPPLKPLLAALHLQPTPPPMVYGARLSQLVPAGDVAALQQRLEEATGQQYLLGAVGGKALVALHTDASIMDRLRAHVHGTILAGSLLAQQDKQEHVLELEAREWMDRSYPVFAEKLQEAGWDLNKVTLARPHYTAVWQPDLGKKVQ